jgi:AcrR family transcriptional regulator
MSTARSDRPYHHGDLAPALRNAARQILEEEGLEALSLRSVARRAGVSHAAPYRHFPSREALLAELAVDGFRELREEIAKAAAVPGAMPDRIARVGAAYARFAARHASLLRLMFSAEFPNRAQIPALAEATESIGQEIGAVLGDPILGLAVWGAVHGLTMLSIDNMIDLGQRQAGMQVLPSRAEILLRSLFSQPM